jgi:hypothetical protein
MSLHESLFEDAKAAANNLFNDKSVGQETTRESLEDLIEEIKGMLESLS